MKRRCLAGTRSGGCLVIDDEVDPARLQHSERLSIVSLCNVPGPGGQLVILEVVIVERRPDEVDLPRCWYSAWRASGHGQVGALLGERLHTWRRLGRDRIDMAFGPYGAGQDAREISATRRQLGDLHAMANAGEEQQFRGLTLGVPSDVFRRTDRIGKHRLKCS